MNCGGVTRNEGIKSDREGRAERVQKEPMTHRDGARRDLEIAVKSKRKIANENNVVWRNDTLVPILKFSPFAIVDN
jgi:hypothetical protein